MKLLLSITLALLSLTSSAFVYAKKAETHLAAEQLSPININKAGAKDLAKGLKGIGLKKAKAIIAYREKHGEFKAIEELASVKGIGVATVAKNFKRIAL